MWLRYGERLDEHGVREAEKGYQNGLCAVEGAELLGGVGRLEREMINPSWAFSFFFSSYSYKRRPASGLQRSQYLDKLQASEEKGRMARIGRSTILQATLSFHQI